MHWQSRGPGHESLTQGNLNAQSPGLSGPPGAAAGRPAVGAESMSLRHRVQCSGSVHDAARDTVACGQ
jgi:hypothetical protein